MMIKRSKKKWKSKRPEANRVKTTECTNQSRNSLSSSGKERHSRNPKKMKSPSNRRYLWHRSKSVPSKTVSFSPYVMHRFAQAPTKVKSDVCRSNSCAGCRQKAAAKRPIASKKKPVIERCTRHTQEQEQCMPVDNMPTVYDSYYPARSPGPARSGVDRVYPEFDYHPSQFPSTGHYFHPEVSDRSHNYLPLEVNPSLSSYGGSSSVGSTYVSDYVSNHPKWHAIKRPLHITPGLRNRGADVKYDFLMAKYSEHNCPKTHPALSDYFSFQRLSLDSGQILGNVSQNKSPSAHLGAAASSRSRSQTRSDRMSQAGPTGASLLQYDNKYYTGFNAPNNYSGRHSNPHADLYQSEAMRDMMYSNASQKYIDKSTIKSSLQARTPRADSEFSSVFQKRRSSSTSCAFPETSSSFGNKFGMNPMTSKKYEFFDDMGIMGRCHPLVRNSTLNPAMFGTRTGLAQRSRSSDASFLAGAGHYDDKEVSGQGRTGLFSGGEYIRSGRRSHGTWMSALGKLESLKTSLGKLENGKYSKLEDTISSSKYTSGNVLRRSSCVNNSNQRITDCHQAAEYMCPTNSSYSSGWTAMKKRAAPYTDSKSVDSDTFFSRFDDSESKRFYDKYACFGNANTSVSEHASRRYKNDAKDADTKTCISGQGRDYASLSSLARDKSLSPVQRRERFNLTHGNASSFLTGNDLPLHLNDDFRKHHSSGLAYDQLPNVSECKGSNPDNNHYSHNFSYLSARNLNMNHTQSNGTKPEFQPSSSTPLNQSWKFLPCSDYTCHSESISGGPARTNGCSALGKSQTGTPCTSFYFDSVASILNSMVDQETDRLKKLAGVIERQQDGSQDISNDIVF